MYKECKQDYDKLYYQLIEAAPSDRIKWNRINEVRNRKKTACDIPSMRNSFGLVSADRKQTVNLLNFEFSKLGEFLFEPNSSNYCKTKTFYQQGDLFL